ncbi:sensor histidine kinase [Methanococcoides methylutens]|uniref:sensor histidine kinase n=1 Tax=Methanococcoides methylutens TaxID=2226 RepID=UPI0006938614|nr:ATP-binding protein [Methanococcoides methylutens]
MNFELLIGFANNAALLLALGLLSEIIIFSPHPNIRFKKCAIGIIIGLVGIALMLSPWQAVPGIFFDTRSILLGIAGLFFGLVPTIIAIIITSLFRIYQGGVGTWTGIAVIITSSTIGLLWRHYQFKPRHAPGIGELYIFGIVIHIFMLLWMLTLPWSIALEVLREISLPVLLIYPIGTVLLGTILSNQILRQESKQKLQKSEAHLRTLLDTIPDLIWLKDPEGLYLSCNSKFERFFGAKEDEIIGKSDYDFVGKVLADYFTQMDKRAIKSNKPTVNEEKVTFADDGHCEILETIKKPMYDSDGQLVGVLGIGRDITERKKYEEKLVQTKMYAEEANRTKSEFMATMSHELRTPLNSVIGFSDLLLAGYTGDLNDKQEKYLTNISKSGKHLLQLINSILDIAKIESGKMDINYTHFSVVEVFEELNDILDPILEARNISLFFEVSPINLKLNADYGKFKQIMYNLINNAMKFGLDDGTVKISAENCDSMIKFIVQDNGIGISKENQLIIFEPFKQLDASTSRSYGGAGLGLFIVKKIVELHGGEIWIESEVGIGTTFMFTIPNDN